MVLLFDALEDSAHWAEAACTIWQWAFEVAQGLNARVTSHKQIVYELGSTFLDRQEVTSRTQ
jgi:hypothetical protein